GCPPCLRSLSSCKTCTRRFSPTWLQLLLLCHTMGQGKGDRGLMLVCRNPTPRYRQYRRKMSERLHTYTMQTGWRFWGACAGCLCEASVQCSSRKHDCRFVVRSRRKCYSMVCCTRTQVATAQGVSGLPVPEDERSLPQRS